MIVDVQRARSLAEEILRAHGAPDGHANLQVELLVEAELRGYASHGLQRLPVLIERIGTGASDPVASGKHDWRAPTFLHVDGQHGLGPVVAVAALDAISERADETGVAIAAIRGSGHLGMLAWYVERAAAAGRIAMAFSLSEAIVHPWGGRRAMLGSNPLAIGIPAQPGPFVVDLATSVVSMGKIHDYAHRGQPLEPGWALDAEGNPTTNPQAARAGALTPFGGAKGYALGLTIELLVAGLTGSAIGTEVAGTLDVDLAPNKGDLLLVIDPRRVGAHDVAERISPYLDAIRNCTPVDGVDRVVAPGDRSRASRERRLIDGIPVADAVWKQLTSLHSTAAKRIEE